MEPTRLKLELYIFLFSVNHQQIALVIDVTAVLPERSKTITGPVPLSLRQAEC